MAQTGTTNSGSIQVDVITPEAELFSGAATMVEVPGSEGVFGVLPGHMPLISLMAPGMVRVSTQDGLKNIFVTSGMAEVNAERCIVLADAVLDPASLSATEVQEKLEDAKQDLADAKTDGARERASKKVAIYTTFQKLALSA